MIASWGPSEVRRCSLWGRGCGAQACSWGRARARLLFGGLKAGFGGRLGEGLSRISVQSEVYSLNAMRPWTWVASGTQASPAGLPEGPCQPPALWVGEGRAVTLPASLTGTRTGFSVCGIRTRMDVKGPVAAPGGAAGSGAQAVGWKRSSASRLLCAAGSRAASLCGTRRSSGPASPAVGTYVGSWGQSRDSRPGLRSVCGRLPGGRCSGTLGPGPSTDRAPQGN